MNGIVTMSGIKLTECESAPDVKIKSKSVFINTTSVSYKRTYSRASELSIYRQWERGNSINGK